PDADAARLGPAATLGLHAAAARAERPARRAALPPETTPLALPHPAPHLVLLQLESFWDARGRAPRADAPALPGWDRLAAEALARGRLSVPGFGANTMRAEFAALTGAPEAALGLDAFNPYAVFARAPVASVAHRLARSGYTTRAIHPHDRRFFGRDRVLPALGFAAFDGEEAFAGAARTGRYVSDAALGDAIAARLAEADRPLCLFAISIAAHGPWDGPDPFAAWAARMAETDAMLARLADAARALPRPVVLLAWGDHVPSLPETATLADWRTDWLAWHSARPGTGARRDIGAAALRAEAEAALAARPA
ncbi:MAG: LTA synthase family protein, partial [Acetobacteraceae bacterium]